MEGKNISVKELFQNPQILRMKCAMVLYELERTLGDLVCKEVKDTSSLRGKSLNMIKSREIERRGDFDESSPEKIIAATYIDEIFNLAEISVRGRSEENCISNLKKLFNSLDIFSIRNAISHPNRPFHPNYWFRVAVLATDPSIEKLGFKSVSRALISAEEGKLMSPPETWLNAPIWSLENNLPEKFDHDITGLIGRKREVKELLDLVKNERLNLIAVVAPGGLGKTALLLDVLKEVVLSPESAEYVDRVLYFTAKTEILTVEGLESQKNSNSTIESLCESISETLGEQVGLDSLTFETACRLFAKEDLLLCVDNLETILRDNPESFEAFYQRLPRNWRVIVTSRVTVNSATVMSLSTLSSGGAKKLARDYLSKRGAERIGDEELDSLVEACDYNPLAIRLTVDGFLIGKKSLSEIQSLAKKQVIEFSYRNLISALSTTAHEILECLFVIPEAVTRTRICTLLEKDLDDISEGINQLRGTSLVTREPGISEEGYSLSSSIRDFLVVKPISAEIRLAVQAKLRKTRQLVSEIEKLQQDSNPLSRNYIPNNLPDAVKVIASDALKVWSKSTSSREGLFDELEKIRQLIRVQDHPSLHRILGLILLKLGDRAQGKEELRVAFRAHSPDVSAGCLLSTELRKDQELQEAHKVASDLLANGWDDHQKSSHFHVGIVLQNFLLPLVWLGETEKVIEYTQDWQQSNSSQGILGTLRAMAFRQSVESERDSTIIQPVLCQAIEVLNKVFSIEGYTGIAVSEGMKLIEQLAYEKNGNQKLGKKSAIKFLTFIDNHLIEICQNHRSYTLNHPSVISWIHDMAGVRVNNFPNPLTSERWQRIISNSLSKDSENEPANERNLTEWIQVFIDKRPRFPNNKFKSFLFAQDKQGQRYFIPKKNFEFEDRIWDKLELSDQLEIIPEPFPPEEGQYPTAMLARLVD